MERLHLENQTVFDNLAINRQKLKYVSYKNPVLTVDRTRLLFHYGDKSVKVVRRRMAAYCTNCTNT